MSSPDLEHLDPIFYRDLRALLDTCKAHGAEYQIVSGYRSLDEQAALYRAHLAGGPLAAPPGSSAHNFGLACDVAAVVAGKLSWADALFEAIHDLAPRYSLLTGQPYPRDAGHVERDGWRLFHDVQGGSSTK